MGNVEEYKEEMKKYMDNGPKRSCEGCRLIMIISDLLALLDEKQSKQGSDS